MRTLKIHHWTAWLVFALIVGIFLTLAALYPVNYIRATYEDWYGEWTQFYLFIAVTLTSAWLVFRCKTPYRRFFIILMLAGIFTAGEEISWGQRLLNIDSPEFFEEHNIQGETNIHNFFSGPVSALSKEIVEWVLGLALWTFGLIYPLLLRMGVPIAQRAESMGLAPCPLYLSPFFLLAAPLEMGLVHFNLQEVGEILVGSGLVCMNIYYIGRSHSSVPAIKQRSPDNGIDSSWVATRTAATFAVVVVIALSTTRWVFSNPRMAEAMEHRLHHGMITFAERYERYGFWSRATDLYERAYLRWPQRVDLLRSLTTNYKMIGDEARYQAAYRELLERTPDVLNNNQRTLNVVEYNLLRAESYRNAGMEDLVEEHMTTALKMAKTIVEFKPDDAEAAYWLGRVYQRNGDYPDAIQAYRRAVQLDPVSKIYAVALQSLEREANGQPDV